MPSNDSFDVAWIAMRDDTIYKGIMDDIRRFKLSREKKQLENYIRTRDRIREGRQLVQSTIANRNLPPPAPEPPEDDDEFGDFDFGDDDRPDPPHDPGPEENTEWEIPDDFVHETHIRDGEDNDDDGVIDGDPEDDSDRDGVADASLAEEMNDDFVLPQTLATPAKDEDVFAEPSEGNAGEITSKPKPKSESTHSSVRDKLKTEIEAKRKEADAAREPITYPHIFASTDPSAIRELIATAEDGDEGAKSHLYNNMAEIEDYFPDMLAEVEGLFGKARTVRNDVADSSFILKNPFANPFSNPQAFATNENLNPQREYITPIIKSEPPKEKPDIGFDVVKGDDLSLLPASLFAKNGPGGDDMSLLPSGWKIDQ